MDEATNQVRAAADSDESRTTATTADVDDENTEQLRAEIEDTRADMSQTINEIQERLSPENLVGQVKETVREATIGKVERVVGQFGETLSEVTEPAREMAERAGIAIKEVGTTVADTFYKNPIPLTLIGLGVGMLVMRNFRGPSYSSSSSRRSLQGRGSDYELGDVGRMGDVGRRERTYGTTGASTLNQVKETASDLANRSTEALTNLGTKAKDSASAVSTRFERMMHENPLAVGAVAIAAGTAIGLVLPSTRIESEYIGETGERLVERVEDVARDALGKVEDAAKQMAPEGQPGQQPRPPA
jgi:ElaB/YqjD/DUF883 family membrane-anchored ribosome-binding protein